MAQRNSGNFLALTQTALIEVIRADLDHPEFELLEEANGRREGLQNP
jgi:hypothetical protein